MEIKQLVTKYCGKEEKLLHFSTIFSIYLKLQESNYILISEMWLFALFFLQFCKSDMSRYGYLKVFQRIHWTEITKVDYMVAAHWRCLFLNENLLSLLAYQCPSYGENIIDLSSAEFSQRVIKVNMMLNIALLKMLLFNGKLLFFFFFFFFFFSPYQGS